jgi:hypothetical protein
MDCLFHELPVVHHDLADALEGMHLNCGIAVSDQFHCLIFSTKTLHHTTTIGIESCPLAEIIEGHCNNGLQREREEEGRGMMS